MIFEDSRNALYCDPNAYIQKRDKKDISEPKKVVFQEPYESLPAFYIDNNFKKGCCDCAPQKIDRKREDRRTNQSECEHKNKKNGGFDLKNFLPLLGMFNKGSGGADLSQLVGLLNNNSSKDAGVNNPMSMISSLFSSGGLGSVLNLFKGMQKTQPSKKELKTTDFEIKNYTRVE